ncbi:MAG: hypothetical protein DI536_10320 [Archangium gephyra]|uniref:Nucleotide-binding protein n=1 Tax=Archangium gephyra TaxID=48 RepID=A0A2W5TI24_9BACT|nr:MAG: hypothetical protein DI536_10320 [Archangium gephyra]
MQKLVITGVLTFVFGVLVGRMTVVAPSPAAEPVARPEAPAQNEPAPLAAVLSGRVAEVLQVPQYTYLRFDSGAWAAVSSVPTLQVGQDVRVLVQTEMADFSSATLGRTFPRIAFGTLDGAEAPPQAPPQDPGVKKAIAAVQAATVTMRVKDVFEGREVLKGQRVLVKGTVDRVNEVQGVHYVHLKDGEGDLLCISALPIDKGAQVTLEGTVVLDKNVGMGVNPVVLEDIAVR